MFAGFNLKLSNEFFYNNFQYYIDIAKESYKKCSQSITSEIEDAIINHFEEGTPLDGNIILKKWFPKYSVDVFISHSHADEDLANAFAGWLYEKFNITSFVDSNVWGYIDDLLGILNDNYSHKRRNGDYGYIYEHESCKKASQYTNIMLLMSLQTIIDNTESVFFLNTDKSVNVIDENGLSSTYSPWIYAELLCADLIRKKPLSEYRDKYFKENFAINAATESRAELKITYNISTNNLKSLNEKNLIDWKERYKNEHNVIPMDLLYKMFVNEVSNGNNSY
ncbi:MAG: hypothetical protein K2G83_03945 [Ruminococcus sp.]|nr:hypothetical protein [Ruminococcus sp.]